MQGAGKRKPVWPRVMAAAGILAALFLVSPAGAADRYWVGNSGNWQDAANWSLTPGGPGGAGAPQERDNAYLTPSNFKNHTVTYSSSSTTTLGNLYIDGPGKNSITLQQDQGYLSSGYLSSGPFGSEYIGYSGSGTLTQKGGSHYAVNIILGYNPGSQGTYNMVDGNLGIGQWGRSLFIGYSGSGTVNQSGGSVDMSFNRGMILGYNSGSSGTYNLSGGRIFGEVKEIGGSGKGTVNLTAGEMMAKYVYLGRNGTLNMKGGSFDGVYDLNIAGTVNQSGGDAGGGWFSLGGTYNLTGGSLTTLISSISGTFTQKGGTFAANKLSLSGTYNLHEGILSGPPGSGLPIEVNSGGVFKVGTGVNVNASTLAVGPAEAGSTGYLTGERNSVFTVGGDFISHSIANKDWDTSKSDLVFLPGVEHLLSVCGVDFGRTLAGYQDNFAWDTLDLTGSTMLHLQDGNADPGGALYVRSILGATLSGNLITDIEGNDLNIYYDPDLKENAYLNHLTFDLIGGGYLSPYHTPVPPTVWLLGSGLLGLIGWRKFRKA